MVSLLSFLMASLFLYLFHTTWHLLPRGGWGLDGLLLLRLQRETERLRERGGDALFSTQAFIFGLNAAGGPTDGRKATGKFIHGKAILKISVRILLLPLLLTSRSLSLLCVHFFLLLLNPHPRPHMHRHERKRENCKLSFDFFLKLAFTLLLKILFLKKFFLWFYTTSHLNAAWDLAVQTKGFKNPTLLLPLTAMTAS